MTVERVLVVAAHPDDVDFAAAGTIAGWTDAGVTVTYLILTDGAAGLPDEGTSQPSADRKAEQIAAAACVGVRDVRFLGYPDGRLHVCDELRRDIARVIRQVRPQRVLIPSPDRDWNRLQASHPDHLAAGEAAIQAIYPDARNARAHPGLIADEHLDAWIVPEAWLMAAPAPNHYVDVTETFDRKVAALRAHASQTGSLPDLEALVRGWLTGTAQTAGLPGGRLAEGFAVVATG